MLGAVPGPAVDVRVGVRVRQVGVGASCPNLQAGPHPYLDVLRDLPVVDARQPFYRSTYALYSQSAIFCELTCKHAEDTGQLVMPQVNLCCPKITG